jgi:hypothetical protein
MERAGTDLAAGVSDLFPVVTSTSPELRLRSVDSE